MRQKGILISVAVVAVAIGYLVMTANISALPQPGPLESWIATKTKDWIIRRAAGESVPKIPAGDTSDVSAGASLFNMGCAACHGKDGRNPTNIGKSMYPRALDLRTPDVQNLSNRELFWVIKNGIRLSGMPGFANVLSNDQLWQVTDYVRTLGRQPRQ